MDDELIIGDPIGSGKNVALAELMRKAAAMQLEAMMMRISDLGPLPR